MPPAVILFLNSPQQVCDSECEETDMRVCVVGLFRDYHMHTKCCVGIIVRASLGSSC